MTGKEMEQWKSCVIHCTMKLSHASFIRYLSGGMMDEKIREF